MLLPRNRRTRKILLSLSEEEHVALKLRADTMGLPLTTFIRSAAIWYTRKEETPYAP